MKNKISLVLFISLFLMAGRCASDSEENQYYKNERMESDRFDGSEQVSKETAIEDWETFLDHSQEVILYSRNNLEKLHYRIEQGDDVQKLELLRQYENYKKDIDALELKKQSRNIAFNSELKNYDQKAHRRNAVFIRQFKREATRIDVELACSTEL